MTENGVLTVDALRGVLDEYTTRISANISEAVEANRKEIVSLKAHVDVEFKSLRDEMDDFRSKVRDSISDALRRHDTEIDLKLEKFRNEVQKELNEKLRNIDDQLDPIGNNVSQLLQSTKNVIDLGKKRDEEIDELKVEARDLDKKVDDLRTYVASSDDRFRPVVTALYGDEQNKTDGLLKKIEGLLLTINAMQVTLIDVQTFVKNRRSIEQSVIRFFADVPWKRVALWGTGILLAGSGGAAVISALRVIFGL